MGKFKIAIQVPRTEYEQNISDKRWKERILDTTYFLANIAVGQNTRVNVEIESNVAVIYTFITPESIFNNSNRIVSFAFESLILWGQYTFILEVNGRSFSIHNDTDFTDIEYAIDKSITDHIQA